MKTNAVQNKALEVECGKSAHARLLRFTFIPVVLTARESAHCSEGDDLEKLSDTERNPIPKFDKNGALLEPQPTNDPHDPLNFSSWQKLSILAILAYWAFLGTTNLIIVVRCTRSSYLL
jgi:hypothetical protein